MKKIFRTSYYTTAILAASFAFTSCDDSKIKGDNESKIEGSEYHGQVRSADDTLSRQERKDGEAERDSAQDGTNTSTGH